MQKFIHSFCFLVIYLFIVIGAYLLLNNLIPLIIDGSWRSYIIWGFVATIVDTFMPLIAGGIGVLLSRLYRTILVKILCVISTAILFVMSEIHLWQYISALYYSGFWEYLWGIILTIFILLFYLEIICLIVYFNKFVK